MDDLIEALGIFRKYMTTDYQLAYPTHCDHDLLTINIEEDTPITDEDVARLDELGFDKLEYGWGSYKFGSC